MKWVSVKCPDCGATLSIEEKRVIAFCSYCGARIISNNENEYVYRHIDEAGIKRAETEQIIRLRQLEIAEKRRIAKEKRTKIKIIVSISFVVVGIIMMSASIFLPNVSEYSGILGFFLLLASAYIWILSYHKRNEEE